MLRSNENSVKIEKENITENMEKFSLKVRYYSFTV